MLCLSNPQKPPTKSNLMMSYLLHLISKSQLAAFHSNALYTPESLSNEGFIHLCNHEQMQRVVAMFYPDTSALYVAVIATELLANPVVFEQSNIELPTFAKDELFPHYYQPLNTDAVIDVVEYAAYQTSPIAAQVLALLKQHRFNRLPVEGTLYRQTWQSTECTAEGTPLGTAMIGLFCQQPESLSRFHKLTYDEVWHHYQGDALELHLIHPDGLEQQVILGQAIGLGELTQFVVPAGVWQAGRVVAGGSYALYGCTMAPGFHIECFQAATATELCRLFPRAKEIITQLAIASGETQMHELSPAKYRNECL
jgi:predicted cupin superfamily sugar epimerase/uncharacterized protein (DUF952 family)